MTLFAWEPGDFCYKDTLHIFTLPVLMINLLANNTFVILRIKIKIKI